MERYSQELGVLSEMVQDVARANHRTEVDVIVDLQELTWLGPEEQERRRDLEALAFPRPVGRGR